MASKNINGHNGPMKPVLRGHFHQGMFFIFFGAGLPLIFRCHNLEERVAISVYVACALLMFGISTVYHRITWTPEKRLFWKKLDHAGIYLMIAGSFTPIAALALNKDSGKVLLATIWSVAFVGILQSIFFVNLPKYISALFYLIAGYLILPYLGEIRENLGSTNVFLIILGGIVYSLGAISYGFKRPVLSPKYFSYHEIFHVFVNIAAAIHFIVISSLIK